ncbi:hypothetical protein D3C71_1973840 [compost metagenome]
MVIITSTLFYTDGLTQRNLHIRNVLVVPKRLEESISEPDNFDILDHFLAEIVVNTVDLFFFKHVTKLFVQLLCGQ